LRNIFFWTFLFVTRVAGSAPDLEVVLAAGAFGVTFFFSAILFHLPPVGPALWREHATNVLGAPVTTVTESV
jgi:hypothetical protein